ncbi:unnamed protein product, partial [Ranitomeya imitator]
EEIAKHRESPEEQDEIPAQERQDVTLLGGPPDPVQTESSNTIPQSKDVTTEQHDRSQMADPLSKEKTKVLKEENYNQMVAMGAEGAKFRQLYEEKVEDMRQELVRQEQEYQQATEALRLAHAAQLERQMYDQEQLLLEVHRLRAQLAEDERIPQPESEEPGWEYERGDGGERRTDEESRASDVIGDR